MFSVILPQIEERHLQDIIDKCDVCLSLAPPAISLMLPAAELATYVTLSPFKWLVGCSPTRRSVITGATGCLNACRHSGSTEGTFYC